MKFFDDMSSEHKLFCVFWVCAALVLSVVAGGVAWYNVEAVRREPPPQVIKFKVEVEK